MDLPKENFAGIDNQNGVHIERAASGTGYWRYKARASSVLLTFLILEAVIERKHMQQKQVIALIDDLIVYQLA